MVIKLFIWRDAFIKVPCCVEDPHVTAAIQTHSSQLKKIDFYLSRYYFKLVGLTFSQRRVVVALTVESKQKSEKYFCRHFSKESTSAKYSLWEWPFLSPTAHSINYQHPFVWHNYYDFNFHSESFNVSSCSREKMDSSQEDKVVRKQCQLSSNAVLWKIYNCEKFVVEIKMSSLSDIVDLSAALICFNLTSFSWIQNEVLNCKCKCILLLQLPQI